MNGHGSMDPRLLQGLYFGRGQGLDKLSVVYQLICRISILYVHVIEGLPGGKNTLLPSSSTAGGGITLIVLLTTS